MELKELKGEVGHSIEGLGPQKAFNKLSQGKKQTGRSEQIMENKKSKFYSHKKTK